MPSKKRSSLAAMKKSALPFSAAIVMSGCSFVVSAAKEHAGIFTGDRLPASVIVDPRQTPRQVIVDGLDDVVDDRAREGGTVTVTVTVADAPNAGSMSRLALSAAVDGGDFGSVADGNNAGAWTEQANALADAAKVELAAALDALPARSGNGADLGGAVLQSVITVGQTGGSVTLISSGIHQSEQLDMLADPTFDTSYVDDVLAPRLEGLALAADVEVRLIGIGTFVDPTSNSFEDRVRAFWTQACQLLDDHDQITCTADGLST